MSEKPSTASLRSARRKAYYAAQFARTEANARRRLARHLRSHPRDRQAVRQYEDARGKGAASALKLTRKGWRLIRRAGER